MTAIACIISRSKKKLVQPSWIVASGLQRQPEQLCLDATCPLAISRSTSCRVSFVTSEPQRLRNMSETLSKTGHGRGRTRSHPNVFEGVLFTTFATGVCTFSYFHPCPSAYLFQPMPIGFAAFSHLAVMASRYWGSLHDASIFLQGAELPARPPFASTTTYVPSFVL